MPKAYSPNDKWSKRAAAEGYRARSVFKLMELDERFRLIRPGTVVLDLGACPGSWLQYAATKVRGRNTKLQGKVIGVDLNPIEPIDGVHTFEADITDKNAIEKILDELDVDTVDVVISDLAPKTSGIKDIDQWRSIELSQAVIAIAMDYLSPEGACVVKVLRGADFDEFYAEQKELWAHTKVVTVKASRDRSKEVYVVLQEKIDTEFL